ncbi:DUF2846 domain-containing protein [Cupriavidus pauculus]|uniref:DUF2846 domain-containing protein n=1 Tax=Cupriavidus pauculus TaxID=82633 RepID=UPI001EE36038|nr:DUF2846 domain-containing protein [Cupriavidus pauculus]GJG96012.1 hypothetical protein CBA19C6_16005 [Cupriavidus pauculus]
MRMTGRVTWVFAAAVLLSGCAATGPSFQEMASSIPTLGGDAGRVYFVRDFTPIGMAIQPELRVNDEVVGRSRPGGFFYIDRKAGTYVASGTTEVDSEYTFDLKAGETRYIRTSISMGILAGRLNFQEEPAANGNAMVAKLSYTGDAPTTTGDIQSASTSGTGRARVSTSPAATVATSTPTSTSAPAIAALAPAPAPAKPAAATVAARPTDAGKAVTLDDLRYLLPTR